MRLLVAENDSALATFLQESFNHEHYSVDLTHDSEEAKKWVEERDYDLAILDLNLARDEGTQVLQYVRAKRRQLPILVLSGRNRAEERVQILDMGADDLVLKPFAFSELSARVRALLRRGGRSAEAVLCIEDLELNRVEHSVKRAGRAIELTPKEFGLLEYLMRNAGQHVTRAQIIEHVWNLSFDTMFAFFVVLYSSAQIDKRKAGQLAMAIQVAFQQMGVFDAASSKVALASADPTPVADVQIIESVKRLQNLGQLPTTPPASPAGSVDRPKMDELQKKLEDALALQIDNRIISVKPNKEGIVVSLREAGFFQSGSTQLGPQTIPALAAIVKIIGPEKMDIRIEGHTDNVPIHNGKYDSNWELSTARATEIIKLFITKFALAPNRLSASGYGEYYPTTSNDTAEGRAMNRRVDLVILNSFSDAGVPTPTAVAPDAIPSDDCAAVAAANDQRAKSCRALGAEFLFTEFIAGKSRQVKQRRAGRSNQKAREAGSEKCARTMTRAQFGCARDRGRTAAGRGSGGRVRSGRRSIRGDFLHHSRRQLLADRARSVVNAALRQRQRAAAVASLGIHALQRNFLLLGIQPGEIHIRKLGSQHRILQKYLSGIFKRLDGRVHRQSQQQSHLGFIQLIGKKPFVLLHHVAVRIHHKQRRQSRHAAIFLHDRAVGHHNRIIDSGLFRELLHVRRIAVVHGYAHNLQTVFVAILQNQSESEFPRGKAGTTSPRNL